MDVVALERLCARGWPGTEQQAVGDWLLRAGHGFTGRANSALVLGAPPGPLPEALALVETWYAERGLAARFQLPIGPGVPAGISAVDQALAVAGWSAGEEIAVLTGDVATALARLPQPRPAEVKAHDPVPQPEWLRLYHYRGAPLPGTALAVLRAGPDPRFTLLRHDGDPVAVTRWVVTDDWVGITALTVPEQHRRHGYASRVLGAALAAARERGAAQLYLQVSCDNTPALTLYGRLGLTEHHRYRYRDRARPS